MKQLKNAISSMLVVPSSNIVENERQCRDESIKYKHVDSMPSVLYECSQRGRTEDRRLCSSREMSERCGL